MRKIILIFLFLLSFPLDGVSQDNDSDWKPSYTAETIDKKYIFVMPSRPGDDYLVGDKYKQRGMYINDGSTTPLWTVDWNGRIYLPKDGKHIVRIYGLDYSATYNEKVFTFFAEGKKLQTYQTKDLIAFPFLLPQSSNGYAIIDSTLSPDLPNDGVLMKIDSGEGYSLNNGAIFDNEKKTMQIETFHGDKFLFDFTTGNIISSSRPSRNLATVLFGILLIAYFVYTGSISKSNLSKSKLKIANYVTGFFLTLFLFFIPVISVWSYKIPFDEYMPVYPEFVILCLLQISMFPRCLLTSLNIFAPPVNNFANVGFEAIFQWLILFWLPLVLIVGFLNHFLISKLSRNRFQ